jgi:hypothetical protein
VLRQEYDNIQKEIGETGKFSADLENKLLKKQQQIEKTTAAVQAQEGRLNELGAALKSAGVDTSKLTEENRRLEHEYASLKQSGGSRESAGGFGTIPLPLSTPFMKRLPLPVSPSCSKRSGRRTSRPRRHPSNLKAP